ncbi:MAG TPA: iron chelate uptake ABC transporter family permease subunit [Pseudomonadales bacterium]|nr:iron chelate uptake ABC transporter family permease subunit [Pseudomonadales bacterium]
MLDILGLPFLACLVLTGIHVYLGLHVLARGVIFVDLALAQVAALGITVAYLAGHPIQSPAAYWYALAFAVAGAALFAVSRTRCAAIPQEAIIGIVYVVSAAAAVLVVDRAPQGSEHIKQLLVGGILTVTPGEVGAVAALYAVVGAGHWLLRRPLLEISLDPEAARARGRRIAAWDLCFYVSFALVVTSSVRMAGVLLVFSYLIIPAALGTLLASSIKGRLAVGWAAGALVSAAGLAAAYRWDLPTGASVVTTFGALAALTALALGAGAIWRGVRARGWRALRGMALVASAAVALAGLLLLAFPAMDHLWLDLLEAGLPRVRTLFLTARERETDTESRAAVARADAELKRLRTLQQDVQWGTRAMPPEMQERLRQFLAGRGEIAAGDRMVLATLRARARARQRLWLGLPLFLGGAALTATALRRRPAGAGS